MIKVPAVLSPEDVLGIHEALVADFASSDDPISPSGVRSMDLLASAVGRQQTSHGDRLKYPDAVSSAATLTFGICCDDPFHNGNKRTALVAMLAHLDRNGLCLRRVSQDELYGLVMSVADHTVSTWSRYLPQERRRPSQRRFDTEVAAGAQWLKKRVDPIRRGERQIPYRTLRKILPKFRCELGQVTSNRVEVTRLEVEPPTFLRRHPREIRRRLGSIGYRDEGSDVSVKDLKAVRLMCWLTEEDGVDSETFYSGAEIVDGFVMRYRTLLRRLGRT